MEGPEKLTDLVDARFLFEGATDLPVEISCCSSFFKLSSNPLQGSWQIGSETFVGDGKHPEDSLSSGSSGTFGTRGG